MYAIQPALVKDNDISRRSRRGLCDAGVSGKDKQLIGAMEWVKEKQELGPEGDWRIYRPDITPEGWRSNITTLGIEMWMTLLPFFSPFSNKTPSRDKRR